MRCTDCCVAVIPVLRYLTRSRANHFAIHYFRAMTRMSDQPSSGFCLAVDMVFLLHHGPMAIGTGRFSRKPDRTAFFHGIPAPSVTNDGRIPSSVGELESSPNKKNSIPPHLVYQMSPEIDTRFWGVGGRFFAPAWILAIG